ncbi:MAG: peptide ABC transporter substrate-binding protein [Gammaproteobacteria bacterium]|nr:peptide ABC transporter substrate-binding protein [Gammaproteobacteria bacterium]
MKRWLGIIVAGIVCLGVVACGDRNEPLPGTTLHRGLGTDPESLDPQKARSVQAADVLRDVREGLLGFSPGGELVAAGAQSWRISDDGLIVTFSLRPDARWSNGDPVTAAHYVLGLRRLVDPQIAAFYSQTVEDIVNARAVINGELPVNALGVSAVDDLTLEIRLERPVPYLLSLLTHPSTFPAHPDQGAAPITNGAYKLKEWQPGSLLQLERNAFYWNDAATSIDHVFYHVLTEELTELNRYRAGELHITDNVPPERFQEVREQYGEQLRVSPYLGVYYYGFNLTRPPFQDNPLLRHALSMAIDREVLVKKITGRGEAPAYSWVPPGTNNYNPPGLGFAELSQDERNAIAKRLYKEAGYGDDNPLTLELRYNTSDTQQRFALAVRAMWEQTLGVRTSLISEEFQVLLENIREQQVTQVFRGSWIGDYNDAQTFLALMQSGSHSNMTGYRNPEYDSLLDRAAEQVDMDRRRLFLEEAERLMLADHAVIPLYFYVSKHLVHPSVNGWQDNVLDYHYSQHLSLDAAL